MMDMPAAIAKVTEKQDLTQAEMLDVMRLIMSGGATPAQIGGFLIGLRMKGETVGEITGAANVMRELQAWQPRCVQQEWQCRSARGGGREYYADP